MSVPRPLLWVSYYFPPDASPGSFRSSAFLRHLSQDHWDIKVLTTRNLAVGRTDQGNLDRVPAGVEIVRTRSFEPYQRIHRVAARSGGASSGDGVDRKGMDMRRRVRKAARWMLNPLYQLTRFPDKQSGWMLPLFFTALRLLWGRHNAVVFSSSPPHSSQFVVYLLRKTRRFHWVADFRDPWTTPFRFPRGRLNAALQSYMERRVLETCDVAIANTPGNRRALLDRFPSLPDSRVVVVTNGFDPEPRGTPSFDPSEAVDCDIVYMGEVYKGMLDLFLGAMTAMRSRAPGELPRVNLFGTVDAGELSRISEMGFDDHIRHRGFVSVDQSERIIREAPSLLLLLPHEHAFATCVPSKLYPYLAARRPVLALVPEGDAATILSEAGAGRAITGTDPDTVAADVLTFVRGVRASTFAVGNEDYISRFSVATLSRQVEELLAGGDER